ncbi:hypothetical protein CGT68_05825 [Vibrio cholerae]|nr:hypothetical protein CGT69_05440 [Vibrio cholerae]PAS45472.1 hypothetical protein CGT68_05825 [Vibrio cholerae]
MLATFVHPNHIVYLCSWGLSHLPPTCSLGINLTDTVSLIGLLHINFVNNVICISFPNRKLTIYFFSLTKIQPCT